MARSASLAAPLLGLALAITALPPARAASPQAWNAYDQQLLKACLAASGLRNPKAAGERLDLPGRGDALSSVLLLEGSFPQPHMAGRRGLELCLYDARSKQARVVDADRLYRNGRQP